MYPANEADIYSPTPEQLERERALKRYNRLYIALPLAFVVTFVAGLLILMLIGLFAPGLVGAESFLSSLADTILVLWMIPMMVFCAIVPLAYVGYLVNLRQRRSQLPPDSPLLRHRRAQMAMWKAQDIAGRAERVTETASDRLTGPIIRLDAAIAYLLAWLAILTRPFRRDDYYEPDGANDPDGTDGNT